MFDVGQGRGGECQYLTTLVLNDPKAWSVSKGKVMFQWKKVDVLRKKVAKWLQQNQDHHLPSGISIRMNVVSAMRGESSEEKKWRRYLKGVRDHNLGQWGDENTLLALSGVVGRPIYAFSGGIDKEVRMFEAAAPLGADRQVEGTPLLFGHLGENHYTPLRICVGGDWDWVLAPEEIRKNPKRWKSCGAVADPRLIVEQTEVEDHIKRLPIESGNQLQVRQGLCGKERNVADDDIMVVDVVP